MMLTKEQFDDLELGDMFEVGTLLEGVSRESLTWTVTEKAEDSARFDVTFHGIHVADFDANVVGGILKWAEV